MELTLGEDQEQLVDAARRFLGRSCEPAVVRAAEAAPHGHDEGLWEVAAGMGWPALCLPEEYGGSGAGLLELALIAEQMGWAAYTSPLLHQTTLVALPLVWVGSADQRRRWLPALASGGAIGAPALLGAGAGDERTSPPIRARRDGSGWRLTGQRDLVPFAGACDVYAVAADLEGPGPSLLVLDADRAGAPVRHAALGGEPLYSVGFDGVGVDEGDVLGAPGTADALLGRALDHATVVWSSYGAGLGERALELSVNHARDRHQFGRPIGSFQAIAHRCADMRVDIDALRWLARQAAGALDAGPTAGSAPGPGPAGTAEAAALQVSAAKAYANEALRRVFMHAHQVHGALGFSLEYDLQLFTRRAKAVELSLGSGTSHRRRVAAGMGLPTGSVTLGGSIPRT